MSFTLPSKADLKENARELRRFFESIPAIANWIGLVTVIIWLLKATWFDHVPEIFPRASDVGRVVEGVLSAIIAGYIFYLLFALWPEFRSRRRLTAFISGKTKSIVGDCMAILIEIQHFSGQTLDIKTALPEQITASFGAIQPAVSPRMGMWNGNAFVSAPWVVFFEDRRIRTHSSIDSLFKQGRYLEPEFVALLTEIGDSPFLMQTKTLMEAVRSTPMINMPPPSHWAGAFSKYMQVCRRLAEWHDRTYDGDVLPILA